MYGCITVARTLDVVAAEERVSFQFSTNSDAIKRGKNEKIYRLLTFACARIDYGKAYRLSKGLSTMKNLIDYRLSMRV